MIAILAGGWGPLRADEAEDAFQEGLKYSKEGEINLAESTTEGIDKSIKRSMHARECFDRAISLKPGDARFHAWRSLASLDLFEKDDALSAAEEAIRLDPQSADGYRARGRAKAEKEDSDGALKDLTEAVRLGPKDDANAVALATFYEERHDTEAALGVFAKALDVVPEKSNILNRRAMLRGSMGDWKAALIDLDEAIRLDPEAIRPRQIRIMALVFLKREQEALPDLDAILKRQDDLAMLTIRAQLLANSGKREEAIRDLNKVIQSEPQASLYAVRGSQYDSLGQHESAIRDFDASLELEMDPRVLIVRGLSKSKLDRWEPAIKDYDQAIELGATKDLQPQMLRGVAYLHLGKLGRALRDFDEALRITPDLPVVKAHRAWVLLLLERPSVVDDIQAWIDLEGWREEGSAQMALIAYFSRRRERHDEAAKGWLRDAIAKGKPNEWPVPVLRSLLGEIPSPVAIALAKDDSQRLEAHYYFGLDRMIDADKPAAIEHLKWVCDHATPASVFRAYAKSILETLGEDPATAPVPR